MKFSINERVSYCGHFGKAKQRAGVITAKETDSQGLTRFVVKLVTGETKWGYESQFKSEE